MTLHDLLSELAAEGMEFWKEGDRLRYRVPEHVLTPERLDGIKQQKNAILNLLDDGAPPARFHSLSHGQQALWFVHQSAPDSASYNVGFTARIRSDLNIDAFRQAVQAVITRHAALRTRFKAIGGKPIQEILAQQDAYIGFVDLSGQDDEAVRQRVIAASQRPFNLERGPLCRVHLFREHGGSHIFLFTVHHIVFDGWSLWLVLDDLQTAYADACAGKPISLTLPALTYADFARQEAALLNGPEGEQLWAYWQQQLSGDLPIIDLPTDRARPPLQTFRGESQAFLLDVGLTERLKELARSSGVTMYVLLLAAFSALLHRYTRQDDLIVGSPSMGRNQAQFEDVVGYFVNMLALRVDVGGDPTFTALLADARRAVLDGLAHQQYPFPLLVEKLQPPHDPGRSPIFQVAFNVLLKKSVNVFTEQTADAPSEAGRLLMEPYDIPQEEGQFDLVAELVEASAHFEGKFKYNSDLFDETTIARLSEHFQQLLRGIAEAPARRLSELPLLTEQERRHILEEWSGSAETPPATTCLHRIFESQAARRPDAAALVFGEQRLTYGELNARANQLARYLQAEGVGPESVVGVFLERSLEMPVAILGILKAGGAYLPLEPDYPQDRLGFMLNDSGPALVLTQKRLEWRLPENEIHRVFLDDDWDGIARHSAETPDSPVTAQNLAYILYTSGSTGRPKGVMITHSNAAAMLAGFERLAPAAPENGAGTTVCPFGFDVSAWEIFAALCSGEALHILTPETFSFPDRFARYLHQHAITTTYIPPALLEPLAEQCEQIAQSSPERPFQLRRMLVGVEPIAQQTLQRYRDLVPDLYIINGYGPTETTICATFFPFQQVSEATRRVPIGKPVAGYRVYLADEALNPVAVGMAGEILIGGAGLGRGYLNRPQLQQEKFIPDPFRPETEDRVYRTGDLGRYLPDGNIEFLGRIDQQIKIRGFRIELGEIEATLKEHPAVKNAAVLARDDAAGQKQLVAYVVAHDRETAPVTQHLRVFLKSMLPDYMVPAAFVALPELPLTRNGKLDRRALPVPEGTGLEDQYVAPTTPAEQTLADVWADVLRVERVGVHDNFFELGGHSLLATEIVAGIAERFHLHLPLKHLFMAPTVAELAQVIETLSRAADDQRQAGAAPSGDDEEEGMI